MGRRRRSSMDCYRDSVIYVWKQVKKWGSNWKELIAIVLRRQ